MAMTRRPSLFVGALVGVIKEWIGAQLVVEESPSEFAFRHALTRQAIAADLLALERRSLHHTVAEIIERIFAAEQDRYLADLAYHFFEAAVWEKAFQYALRAGEHAAMLHAPQAASAQFTRAGRRRASGDCAGSPNLSPTRVGI
jgi:hypothetical protein